MVEQRHRAMQVRQTWSMRMTLVMTMIMVIVRSSASRIRHCKVDYLCYHPRKTHKKQIRTKCIEQNEFTRLRKLHNTRVMTRVCLNSCACLNVKHIFLH